MKKYLGLFVGITMVTLAAVVYEQTSAPNLQGDLAPAGMSTGGTTGGGTTGGRFLSSSPMCGGANASQCGGRCGDPSYSCMWSTITRSCFCRDPNQGVCNGGAGTCGGTCAVNTDTCQWNGNASTCVCRDACLGNPMTSGLPNCSNPPPTDNLRVQLGQPCGIAPACVVRNGNTCSRVSPILRCDAGLVCSRDDSGSLGICLGGARSSMSY